MIDLGLVPPGSTIRVPFGSFAGTTGAPSAATNLAAADVQIYKDGGTTQRASTAGITVTADFDTLTGVNLIAIDLADNTTAGFYAAGSEYVVVISDVTIDTQTMRFPIARFRIGLPNAVLNTTIATLSSQTSFTLTAGPAEDNALLGCVVYIHDVASAVQGGFGVVTGYTGSTKTVTLAAGTTFTAAASDNISIYPPTNVRLYNGVAGTFASGRPEVNVTHNAGTAITAAAGRQEVNATHFGGTALTQTGGRPEVNATHIDGAAATNLRHALSTMQVVTVSTGSTSTSITTQNLSGVEATNDHYKGKALYFLTGNLAKQIVEITAYNGSTGTLTVTATPSGESPANNDTALIV